MQERLRNYWNVIYTRLNGLQRGQQVRLGITALVLLLTIGVAVYITAKPQKRILFSNKEYEFIAQVETSLKNNSIKSWMIESGRGIEVSERDFAKAKVVLAQDKVSNNSQEFTYEDALLNDGMGTSETTRKENNRRARQTDLAKQLELFEGVTKASVLLEIPDSNNFYKQTKQESTANVLLTLSRAFDREEGLSVARFVAASIMGLSIDNIEIMDQNKNVVYSGMRLSEANGTSDLDIESQIKREMTVAIKNVAQPLFDEAELLLNLNFNRDVEVLKSVKYAPYSQESDIGLIANQRVDKSSMMGGNTEATPGVEANNATTTNYQTGSNDNVDAKTSSLESQHLYDTHESMLEKGKGDIIYEQSSASLTVYTYRDYYQDYMESNGRLGDMTWEDFQDSVPKRQPIEIDDAFIESLQSGTGIEKFTVVGYEVPVFHDKEVVPIDFQQLAMFAILALLILLLAYGLIKKTQPDEVIEIEPELLVEDLLVSDRLEEDRLSDTDKLKEIELSEINETKKQIDKFVNEKPEAVAQLLRNWLNEEWE